MKRETTRVWHSDGSATDIITTIHETHTFFGTVTHKEVHKIHHTKEELEAEAKASLIVGGAILVGGLVVAGISALFGDSKDSTKSLKPSISGHHHHK